MPGRRMIALPVKDNHETKIPDPKLDIAREYHPEDFTLTDTSYSRQFNPADMEYEKGHKTHNFPTLSSNERIEENTVGQTVEDTVYTRFDHLLIGVTNAQEAMVRLLTSISTQLALVLDDLYKSRAFEESMYPVSKTVEIELDYKQRHYLYVYTTTTVTLTGNDSSTLALVAGWNSFSFRRGLKFTAAAVPDTQPIFLLVRATDQPLALVSH